MSNILFVLYHDFGANSAVHVHNFANNLVAFGHPVAAVVPGGDDLGAGLGEQRYSVRHFHEIDGNWSRLFKNGRPPEIVHAWTPRENVRLFCERLRTLCSFTLFVHLEDNEDLILEANLGTPFDELVRRENLEVPPNLSHPRRYRRFLKSAAAVTMIIDRLDEFVPPEVPKLVLWPGADHTMFFRRPKNEEFLKRLGIAPGNLVLCYTGNVHSANAREVRSLYVAVAILNRQNVPATLVRAGKDYCPFLGPDDSWARQISVDLGYIRHVEVPEVLGLADYLIQPGFGDDFNDYRLPAKLPEFFAMGRPVILPNTNVGRFVQHGEHAWVLPKADASNIVDALQALHGNPPLVKRLADGALAFAERHFDWKKNAQQLEKFYKSVVARADSSLLTSADAEAGR
jgi:glycosyltransferase involved in cell wall biosynthesis